MLSRISTRSHRSHFTSRPISCKRAELHWRVALPMMCVVLTLLAVPLSRLNPRQGRYARVWVAVVVYFVYSNLISAGKVWIAHGTVPGVARAVVDSRGGHPAGAGGRVRSPLARARAPPGRRPMSILDRYIMRSILGAALLVMSVLLVLGALFVFIDQQDDIGVGHYTVLERFVVHAAEPAAAGCSICCPITALIGSLLGLGTLARGSEITVIRATGISMRASAGIVPASPACC